MYMYMYIFAILPQKAFLKFIIILAWKKVKLQTDKVSQWKGLLEATDILISFRTATIAELDTEYANFSSNMSKRAATIKAAQDAIVAVTTTITTTTVATTTTTIKTGRKKREGNERTIWNLRNIT